VFDAEKMIFPAMILKLSLCVKRDKKNFQNWDFLLGVPAQMIEKLA